MHEPHDPPVVSYKRRDGSVVENPTQAERSSIGVCLVSPSSYKIWEPQLALLKCFCDITLEIDPTLPEHHSVGIIGTRKEDHEP